MKVLCIPAGASLLHVLCLRYLVWTVMNHCARLVSPNAPTTTTLADADAATDPADFPASATPQPREDHLSSLPGLPGICHVPCQGCITRGPATRLSSTLAGRLRGTLAVSQQRTPGLFPVQGYAALPQCTVFNGKLRKLHKFPMRNLHRGSRYVCVTNWA